MAQSAARRFLRTIGSVTGYFILFDESNLSFSVKFQEFGFAYYGAWSSTISEARPMSVYGLDADFLESGELLPTGRFIVANFITRIVFRQKHPDLFPQANCSENPGKFRLGC